VNAFPDGWDTFLLPPAGSFAPLYKLGRALVPGFVSAFPGGALAEYWQSLPRTQTLIELMFSEAFAAEGNWSISYWNEEKGWPTDFLAPAGLAQYTRFVAENRGFYTGPRDRNPVAIVYTNQGVLADPDRNESYVGLAQALDRLHVQYDVLYGGDDRFWAAPIDESLLAKYHVVFLPNANALTTEQIGVFTRRATSGAATIALAPIDPGLSAAGLTALTDLGQQYRRGDLDGASAALDAALSNAGAERVVRTVSAPDLLVSAQFRTDGPRFVVHFVNEAYNSNQDSVPDRTNIDVVVRRPAAVDSTWKLSLCAPGGAPRTLGYQLEGDEIRIRIPNLHIYGVLVFTPPT
jgi:hypothetical protein